MDSTCCTSKNISQSDKLGGRRGEVDFGAYCKQLVGYDVTEIKSLMTALGANMTKAEVFDKATKLAMKGDLALYDEILHPDYESMNQRVRIN